MFIGAVVVQLAGCGDHVHWFALERGELDVKDAGSVIGLIQSAL